MRIAVDARPLSAPLTGIGRYTQALLQEMAASGHQWFIYSDRPLQVPLPESPRICVRTGSARGGTPGSLRWAQWAYARWAIQDVVDVFWSPRHHLPLLLPARIASVVTIHDLVWCQFPETMKPKNLLLERVLMGPSIAAADKVICVSKFTASEVSRYYPAAVGKCSVIHEAANLPVQRNGASVEGIPPRYLLFVGTLEPRKNLPRLLHAYAQLKDDESVPPLVIVGGGGWGKEDLAAIICDLGLESRVVLCGYVDNATLQALYAGAFCLVMPSLYEGFGLPALEAMHFGVPVIASSTGSLPEVVANAGVLVNPYAEGDIAGAIARLVHDAEFHAELSAKSLHRAAQFSWQQAAAETLKVFAEALASHEPKAYRHRVAEQRLG